MAVECATLKLLNQLGKHRGGCAFAKSCDGTTCHLQPAAEAVQTLSPDIATLEDHLQERLFGDILLIKIKSG